MFMNQYILEFSHHFRKMFQLLMTKMVFPDNPNEILNMFLLGEYVQTYVI